MLLIKFNKLEFSNNESNYSLKVNHFKFNKNISLTDERQRLIKSSLIKIANIEDI